MSRGGAHDVAAEACAEALVAEADAEDRAPAREARGSTSFEMPASRGVPGPGEMTMPSRLERRDRLGA